MLSTINLDDQPLLPADKINNKWSSIASCRTKRLKPLRPTVDSEQKTHELPLGVGLLATEAIGDALRNANRPTIEGPAR